MVDPGYEAMVDCGQEIVRSLSTDPTGFTVSFVSKRLVSPTMLRETNELNETKTKKASRLYTEVLEKVEQYPEKYNEFVDTLKEKKECDTVLKLGLKYTLHGRSIIASIVSVVYVISLWYSSFQ